MGFFRAEGSATLITEAQRSREASLRTKQLRYSATMLFRTVAFVVAVVLPIPIWAKIVLIFLSFILPWTAVIVANAPAKRQKTGDRYTHSEETAPPLQLDPTTVVRGDVVPPRERLEN